MDKLKVVIISDSIDERLSIKALLDADDIAVAGYSGYDDTALIKVLGLMPDVVICVHTPSNPRVFELSQNIYTCLQGCTVILLCDSVELDLMDLAMNSGIRKVLPFKISPEELQEHIRQANSLEKQRCKSVPQDRVLSSKVISFFGGKGGVGKTTVAVNTATALSQMGKKTIIIDCDLQFGDINLLFDIEPKDTILELVQERGQLSIDIIRSFTMLHSSGVEVLCAPKSPEYAEYVTGRHIESLINILRPYYQYIIIDLAPFFNDVAIATMENSDNIILVSALNISSLKSSKVCLNILETLQQREKLSLIVNKSTESTIKTRDFENILGLKLFGNILEDTKTALTSLNNGVPIVMSAPRSQPAREIKNIAEKIVREFV